MRVHRGGLVPLRRSLRGALNAAAVVSAVLTAGCGHTPKYAYPGSYVGATMVASAPTAPSRADTEGDGMPAQVPPRAGIRQIPDDPREPWSPNYGGPATVRQASGPAEAPPPPGAAPAASQGWAASVSRTVAGPVAWLPPRSQ